MKMRFSLTKVAGAALAIGGALLASMQTASATAAAAVDVTDIVTGIGNQLTPLQTVGMASLGLVVGVKVIKWIRRAL